VGDHVPKNEKEEKERRSRSLGQDIRHFSVPSSPRPLPYQGNSYLRGGEAVSVVELLGPNSRPRLPTSSSLWLLGFEEYLFQNMQQQKHS
jgi:hypothetical protein